MTSKIDQVRLHFIMWDKWILEIKWDNQECYQKMLKEINKVDN
jgi:hypothetical protein